MGHTHFLVRMKHVHIQTKYKLCRFSDSAYELNALIFAFEMALHNIKIHGEFMFIVLNFNFFYLKY